MSFKQRLHNWINGQWYGRPGLFLWMLFPLTWLYRVISVVGYKRALLSATSRLPVPVIVVGNISVGGTGKTPLVLYLIEQLTQRGLKVGVVSRGYGGHAEAYPQAVGQQTSAAIVGDEPQMIWEKAGCPVFVAPKRRLAAQALVDSCAVDLSICDDGLQHRALPRDYEICVVDGSRGLGNGWLLPLGPLREPANRLESVNFIVQNGNSRTGCELPEDLPPKAIMTLVADNLSGVGLKQGQTLALNALAGKTVHAFAGIGHPERFFALLGQYAGSIVEHPRPDHYSYTNDDFVGFTLTDLVVMTEKDAVKCSALGLVNAWALPVKASLSVDLADDICQHLGLSE